MSWAYYALQVMAGAFILFIGLEFLPLVVLFVIDRTQIGDAIRRNYPVIGRFRGLFTTLGEFFRQYFFAMDREEMPFNRAQRNWVYNAAQARGTRFRLDPQPQYPRNADLPERGLSAAR